MSFLIIYGTAIGFLITVFPVHVFNYVFISSMNGTMEINVSLYRLIPVIKLSTETNLKHKIKNTIKSKKDGDDKIPETLNILEAYNKLCITKIVQLTDFGVKNQANVYAALAQNALTNALYCFVKANGGITKLRNFTILNCEHDKVNYYLKVAGVINFVTLSRLFIIYLWSKINERKIKKNAE